MSVVPDVPLEMPATPACGRCNRGRRAAVMVSGALLCGDCFLRLAIRAHTEAVAGGKITASVDLSYCRRRRGSGSEDGRSS